MPDPEALTSLIPSKIRRDYTRTDRYRDLRWVFLPSRDGRQVLWQIFAWCHMFRLAAVAGDTHENLSPRGRAQRRAAHHGDAERRARGKTRSNRKRERRPRLRACRVR